jgi:PleD family two-component response regulator
MTIEEAREVLESIRTEVSGTDFGEVGTKTISVGMTQFNGREKADDIFDRADKALYEAKGIGKNTVVLA